MELQAKQVASFLKILANPNKLLILCLLEKGECCVSTLHTSLESISMAAISQHLSTLRLAGLVTSRKEGQLVYYRLADDKIVEFMQTLKRLYCD